MLSRSRAAVRVVVFPAPAAPLDYQQSAGTGQGTDHLALRIVESALPRDHRPDPSRHCGMFGACRQPGDEVSFDCEYAM
jgi:hypothetical protein